MRGLFCILLLQICSTERPPGWETWLSTNINEYENIEIAWENASLVPAWLSGTYLKNGPARFNFGGETSFKNMADGYAKINKFNVDATGVRYSSKFLKTPVYQLCEDEGDIVPQITMGPVEPDTWGMADMNTISANGGDNTMVTIIKMGNEFIATTDLPKVNIFNVTSLEWGEYFDPKLKSTASSAHWRKEPGTDNILNFHVKGTMGVWESIHLYRYPGGDLHNPQEIGSFHIEHSTMIHMFSVTTNYAVFFVYPIGINMVCVVEHFLHNLLECVKWKGETKMTDVYVMSLKTGNVVSHTKTEALYSTHHVNAYETNENGLNMVVADLVIPPWWALTNTTDRDTLLNHVDSGAMENEFEIKRFLIDIDNDQIFSTSWENDSPLAQPYYNQFDFPIINPNYEGRPYCYAYGQALVEAQRQYLVKKNICDSTQDKIWWKEYHYTGEPFFIPRPDATEEDDGVILVIVLDGTTELSYLLLLDGQTFETLTEARLETFIPMSVHGTWVPEIL